jgi:hypothetical protein
MAAAETEAGMRRPGRRARRGRWKSPIWSSKTAEKGLNFVERERKKGVEQRRPKKSSAAAQIEHRVAACKELNHEL